MNKRYVFLILTASVLIASCSVSPQNLASNASRLQPDMITDDITERSERIAEHVKEHPCIERAVATIIGSSALIGIDLAGEYSDNEIIELRRHVRDKVLLFDAGIKNAVVTITPHLIDKATDFAGENKKPRHYISDKLEEISVPSAPVL